MVEHLTFNQVVRGSNPRCLTVKSVEDFNAFFLVYKTIYTIVTLDEMKVVVEDENVQLRRNEWG